MRINNERWLSTNEALQKNTEAIMQQNLINREQNELTRSLWERLPQLFQASGISLSNPLPLETRSQLPLYISPSQTSSFSFSSSFSSQKPTQPTESPKSGPFQEGIIFRTHVYVYFYV